MFTKHLSSVEETYFQHLKHAVRFAAVMFLGSLACMIHAIFPFLFEKTGSSYISALHQDMVVNRHKLSRKKEEKAALN